MDRFWFSTKWRLKLSQNTVQIQLVDHLQKKLKTVDCHPDISSLLKYVSALVVNIKMAAKLHFSLIVAPIVVQLSPIKTPLVMPYEAIEQKTL